MLVHIVDLRLLPKFSIDIDDYLSGVKKPCRWKEFVRSRKQCLNKSPLGIYNTDQEMFFRRCRAWIQSQILTCKHLVGDKTLSYLQQLSIRRRKQFNITDKTSRRRWAIVDNEETLLRIDGSDQQGSNLLQFQEIEFSSGADVEYLAQTRPLIDTTEITEYKRRCSEAHSVANLFQWLQSHVLDLFSTDAGEKQIAFLSRTTAPLLQRCRLDFTRTLNARKQPQTWRNTDTMYLI